MTFDFQDIKLRPERWNTIF